MLKLYSIKDNKLGRFGNVVTKEHELNFIRDLRSLTNDVDGTIKSYPSDYDGYQIGTFDIETGKITPMDPVFIVSCSSLVKINQNQEDS